MADLDQREQELKAFLAFHGPQLTAMGLPEPLHRRLFTKLKFSDFDLGQKVQIVIDEEDEQLYLRTTEQL